MSSRLSRWFVLALGTVLCVSMRLDAQKAAPALPDILKAAADYIVQYSEKMQAVGADEEFLQMDTSGGLNHIRRINGDAVMVGLGDGHLALFRDVYAIDTKLLHERTPRLLKLFENPPGQAGGTLQYASQFTVDSVRQYADGKLHYLDSPLAPLELLRAEYRQSLACKIDGMKTTDGVQVAVVRFTETGKPSLLMTPSTMPVTGRFWIEVPSGAIREFEITASDKNSMYRATTTFTFDKSLNLWLPQELSQRFDVSIMGSGGDNGPREHSSFDTHAKYTKFRQVKIDLDKIR